MQIGPAEGKCSLLSSRNGRYNRQMKETGKKKLCHTVFVIAAFTAAIALCAFFFIRKKKSFIADPELPEWVVWEIRDASADLLGDGGEERLLLKDGTLRVHSGDTLLYETKKEWKIADIDALDLTENGKTEILMLVWKKGSFGTSKPFWIERDDTGWSQHIFVFECREGKIEPLWMSSDLGMEVREWRTDEEKRLHLISVKGTETVWAWDSWGFTLVGEQPAAAREENASSDDSGPAGSGEGRSGDEGSSEADQPEKQSGSADLAGNGSGELTMIAVGDNLIHESIYRACGDPESGIFDFTPLYKEVKNEISGYDLAVVNQETALVSDPGLYGSFPDFGTPSEAGDALADAGFDVVCAATNHVNDKGKAGMEETLRFWKQYPDITLLGLHESAGAYQKIDWVEKNGIRLALFNYTFGLNGHALPADEKWRVNLLTDEQKLIRDLEAAEEEADVSVCFLHAGAEYSSGPSAELREIAERLTAAGADLIICTHPHVVQKAEIITDESEQDPSSARRSIVCWSLGNFISNQMNPETAVGAAADIRFTLADRAPDEEAASGTETFLSGEDAKWSTDPLCVLSGGKRTVVISCRLRPTVCHFRKGKTQAFFLESYTDELAAAHSLSTADHPLSVQTLLTIWKEKSQ